MYVNAVLHPAGGTARIDMQGLMRAALAIPDDVDGILMRAREGDPVAFTALVRRHQSMVFSLALHALRDRAAAEDLAQDVFLELYLGLGRIESAAHLAAWLRGSRATAASTSCGGCHAASSWRSIRFPIVRHRSLPAKCFSNGGSRAGGPPAGGRADGDAPALPGGSLVQVYGWREGNQPGGLAILVAEPRELRIVNIVWPFDLARLGALQGQFGIPVLPRAVPRR
jgi:hypothetical protein